MTLATPLPSKSIDPYPNWGESLPLPSPLKQTLKQSNDPHPNWGEPKLPSGGRTEHQIHQQSAVKPRLKQTIKRSNDPTAYKNDPHPSWGEPQLPSRGRTEHQNNHKSVLKQRLKPKTIKRSREPGYSHTKKPGPSNYFKADFPQTDLIPRSKQTIKRSNNPNHAAYDLKPEPSAYFEADFQTDASPLLKQTQIKRSNEPYPSLPPMESYSIMPPKYAYEYDVNDGPYGPVFGLKENSNGYDTNGEYNVDLPDGQHQTVVYNVHGSDGYIADVSYGGIDGYSQSYSQPKPVSAYKPKPIYKHEPYVTHKPPTYFDSDFSFKPLAPKPVQSSYPEIQPELKTIDPEVDSGPIIDEIPVEIEPEGPNEEVRTYSFEVLENEPTDEVAPPMKEDLKVEMLNIMNDPMETIRTAPTKGMMLNIMNDPMETIRTAPAKGVKTPIKIDTAPMGEVATQIELMKAALNIAPNDNVVVSNIQSPTPPDPAEMNKSHMDFMKAALRTAPLKEVETPIIEKDATPMGEVATQIELMKAALKIAPLKKEVKIPKKPIADIKNIIPKEMFSSNLMEDTFETIGNLNGNSAPAEVNPAPIRDDFTLNTENLAPTNENIAPMRILPAPKVVPARTRVGPAPTKEIPTPIQENPRSRNPVPNRENSAPEEENIAPMRILPAPKVVPARTRVGPAPTKEIPAPIQENPRSRNPPNRENLAPETENIAPMRFLPAPRVVPAGEKPTPAPIFEIPAPIRAAPIRLRPAPMRRLPAPKVVTPNKIPMRRLPAPKVVTDSAPEEEKSADLLEKFPLEFTSMNNIPMEIMKVLSPSEVFALSEPIEQSAPIRIMDDPTEVDEIEIFEDINEPFEEDIDPLTAIQIMEDALKSANILSDEIDMPLRLKLMEVAQSFLPSDLGYTNPPSEDTVDDLEVAGDMEIDGGLLAEESVIRQTFRVPAPFRRRKITVAPPNWSNFDQATPIIEENNPPVPNRRNSVPKRDYVPKLTPPDWSNWSTF